MADFKNITEQIIDLYSPQKILLFGSRAKGTATERSDIDLCIIMETQRNKERRRLLADMYCDIESPVPIDILLYTPEEWEHCVKDKCTFAYKINKEGIALYG